MISRRFLLAEDVSDNTFDVLYYIKTTADPSAWIFGSYYMDKILRSPLTRTFDMPSQRFTDKLTLFGIPVIQDDSEYEFDFLP